MRDFTLNMFVLLLESLRKAGYSFLRYEDSLKQPKGKFVILRHDVDRNPANALLLAILERQSGIAGSYYFRAKRKEKERGNIGEIVRLGHEVGYHYENLSSSHGDMDQAMNTFEQDLAFFRQFYPVSTICMHGSPLSKHDNRFLWAFHNYHSFDIVAEPYFDLDITNTLYISDTGRRWDSKASIRDTPGIKTGNTLIPEWDKWSVIPSEKSMLRIKPGTGALYDSFSFHGTEDIIEALSAGKMPDKIMINIHPQRWHNNYFKWLTELVLQNLKNIVKRMMKNKKTAS
jgi:hypothetical protein